MHHPESNGNGNALHMSNSRDHIRYAHPLNVSDVEMATRADTFYALLNVAVPFVPSLIVRFPGRLLNPVFVPLAPRPAGHISNPGTLQLSRTRRQKRPFARLPRQKSVHSMMAAPVRNGLMPCSPLARMPANLSWRRHHG